MACDRCRGLARSLVHVASRARAPAKTTTRPALVMTFTTASRPLAPPRAPPSWRPLQRRRCFSGTAHPRLRGLKESLAQTYRVLGASEQLYKACSRGANYRIPEEERKLDRVMRLDDGEELGWPVDADNVWHKVFGLPPSFSTWSHVTMLYLYLVNARVRCLEAGDYRGWQQQLVDHFFFDCEKKMHLDHNITSSALRQRYLKDIFVQWRGLLLAYDEGIVKGDAVLASAVWRNLFKGAPTVDPRALAVVVEWMRCSLAALEAAPDAIFAERAQEILARPVAVFWAKLEKRLEKPGPGAQSATTPRTARGPVDKPPPQPAAPA